MIIAIALLNTSDASCVSCLGSTGLRSAAVELSNGSTNPITVELDTRRKIFLCAICAANIAATINAQLSLLRQEHESRKL